MGLILFPPIGMAHHSDKAKWGAYFAMREAKGDHIEAAKYYKKWVPEEPVSKWKDFATRVYKAVKDGLGVAARAKPGPKPKITDELALTIGTVYTQRLVWEHGKCRHYRDMNEMRRRLRPRPPLSGCAPAAVPWLPASAADFSPSAATGMPAPPPAQGLMRCAWHHPRVPAKAREESGPGARLWARADQACIHSATEGSMA